MKTPKARMDELAEKLGILEGGRTRNEPHDVPYLVCRCCDEFPALPRPEMRRERLPNDDGDRPVGIAFELPAMRLVKQ